MLAEQFRYRTRLPPRNRMRRVPNGRPVLPARFAGGTSGPSTMSRCRGYQPAGNKPG